MRSLPINATPSNHPKQTSLVFLTVAHQVQHQRVGREVQFVGGRVDHAGNLAGGFDAAQLNEARVVLDRGPDELGAARFAFGPNHNRLFLLHGFFDDVPRPLRLLLRHLRGQKKSKGVEVKHTQLAAEVR